MKKYLIASIALLGLSLPLLTNAAIGSSPVQQVACSATTGSVLKCVLPGLPTAGNFLVLGEGEVGATPTITSVSGNGTWKLITQANGNGSADFEIWSAEDVTAATTTITITLSGTIVTSARANVSEWSGVATANSLDAFGTTTFPTTSNVTTSVITPTPGLNELIFAGFKGPTVTAGATQGFINLATTSMATMEAYLVVPATSGSYFTSWSGGSSQANTGIASFKAAAATTYVQPPPPADVSVYNSTAIYASTSIY